MGFRYRGFRVEVYITEWRHMNGYSGTAVFLRRLHFRIRLLGLIMVIGFRVYRGLKSILNRSATVVPDVLVPR